MKASATRERERERESCVPQTKLRNYFKENKKIAA